MTPYAFGASVAVFIKRSADNMAVQPPPAVPPVPKPYRPRPLSYDARTVMSRYVGHPQQGVWDPAHGREQLGAHFPKVFTEDTLKSMSDRDAYNETMNRGIVQPGRQTMTQFQQVNARLHNGIPPLFPGDLPPNDPRRAKYDAYVKSQQPPAGQVNNQLPGHAPPLSTVGIDPPVQTPPLSR